MTASSSMCDYQSTSVLDTEVGRQRLVTTALKLTENTAIAPKLYERSLLEKFVAGTLTIDEVIALLEGQQGQGA